jgi:hypothetical protein
MDDRRIGRGQLMGEKDGGISGSATGDKGTEVPPKVASTSETIVIEHVQVVQVASHQVLAFSAGVPAREGVVFV